MQGQLSPEQMKCVTRDTLEGTPPGNQRRCAGSDSERDSGNKAAMHNRQTYHLFSDHATFVHTPFQGASDGTYELRNFELE